MFETPGANGGPRAMIPFQREMTFEYGRPDQVSPRIQRIVANNPGPFTYLGTGTYLVGGDEVAVIDPGPLLDEHLAALMKALEGRRLTHILTTHTHADHSPLAHPLQELAGGAIVGRSSPPEPSSEGEADEVAFRPDVEVEDGQTIAGPGWTLQAIATPGHASNHVCYALTEENALFCGDHIMGWSTTVISPPDGDMGAYYASLDKVQARGFDVLWPTHGPPVREVSPFIDAYRDHRLRRERQILKELTAGPRTIAELTPRLYAGIDKRLFPAARRSVWAHLIHMAAGGQIAVDGAATMEASYRLPGLSDHTTI
jgi:glyoxylase-like metal-dependent hydrolase (beta-lactamase superfamily II)